MLGEHSSGSRIFVMKELSTHDREKSGGNTVEGRSLAFWKLMSTSENAHAVDTHSHTFLSPVDFNPEISLHTGAVRLHFSVTTA